MLRAKCNQEVGNVNKENMDDIRTEVNMREADDVVKNIYSVGCGWESNC